MVYRDYCFRNHLSKADKNERHLMEEEILLDPKVTRLLNQIDKNAMKVKGQLTNDYALSAQ